ncbi:hypothetical protein QCA50_016478 [Cerrena zonata]|uniref:Uncharacterized protein n=1 Tax=Cerrena zonata TaxID=2478898 RepID=A0AAW0FN91_9APHY
MSSTPVLSYKKPSTVNKSNSESNSSSHSSTPAASKPGTPRLSSSSNTSTGVNTGRKILSRRKALQEFYHIQGLQKSEKQEDDNTNQNKEAKEDNDNKQKIDFTNPDTLRQNIKSDLSKSKVPSEPVQSNEDINKGFKNLSLQVNEKASKPSAYQISETYLDDVFNDLSSFIKQQSDQFDHPFEKVIENLQQDMDDSVSNSSITGIIEKEPVPKYLKNINKEELIKELTAVMGNARLVQDDSVKKTYKESIQKVLKTLDNEKDELLILQLNDLKKKFL